MIKKKKKGKLLIRTGIVIGILVLLYAVARISGGLRLYTSPTLANSPGIEAGDYIFVSNWVTPKRFDFICYLGEDPLFGPGVFTHRLCGLPGDTVEIRSGVLFVNGRNADDNLHVKHIYFVPSHNSYEIRKLNGVEYLGRFGVLQDSVQLAIDPKMIEPWMKARQIFYDQSGQVHQSFPSGWTLSNFGPLIIEEGKYFVLGDNRDNSVDSRSRGLINESEITGVVLNKN